MPEDGLNDFSMTSLGNCRTSIYTADRSYIEKGSHIRNVSGTEGKKNKKHSNLVLSLSVPRNPGNGTFCSLGELRVSVFWDVSKFSLTDFLGAVGIFFFQFQKFNFKTKRHV